MFRRIVLTAMTAAAVGMMLSTSPAVGATIDVLHSAYLIDNTADASGRTETLSFSAGAIADKLVVQVAGEGGSITSITYNGEDLTLVAGTSGGGGRNKGIYYLDNPYTGGAADLSVTLSVTQNNGLAFGVVSLAGAASGTSVIAPDSATTSISITPAVADSFVFAGHASNGSGSATANAPLAQVYGGTNIGSAQGSAGYQNGVGNVLSTYSFSSSTTNAGTNAVAFAPSDDGRLSITDLFATGVDANRAALADGTIGDPHYTLISVPGGSTDIRVRTSAGGYPIGPWLGDGPTSTWIGANNAANLDSPPGQYAAETTFTVPADADLSSIEIFGSWGTDNAAIDILLNGNSLVGSGDISAGELGSGFGTLTDFSIGPGTAYFQHGSNTLEFVWSNSGSSDSPGGLRVGYLVGSYLIPEPGSLALLGIALSGLIGTRRRTRR